MPPDDLQPVGRWVHSFEEDHDGASVYRPAAFPFPRARGRRELVLRPDGTCTVGAIGRGDAPEHHEGTWQETAPGTITCAAHGHTLRVTRTGSDRLELVDEPDP